MDDITSAVALIAEVIGLIVLLATYYKKNKKLMDKIAEGTRCQLRSEMLRIYYHNRESRTIRQYEYENFVKLYESYKSLGGNSFIDKIDSEVMEFEVIS